MNRMLSAAPLLAMAVCVMQAEGCNAETAAFNVFKEQGLVLLRPARSYIRPGGLVSVKQHSTVYRDPADPVPTDRKVATQFSAIIMNQALKKSTGLGAALTLVGTLIPLPIGLKYNSAQQVELGQIDSSGTRLVSDALDAQIQKRHTSAKARELLNGGSKVFIVQEVYLGKGIDLTSANNMALDVSYGADSVQSCTPEKTGADTKGKPAAAESKNPEEAKKGGEAKRAGDAKKDEGSALSKAASEVAKIAEDTADLGLSVTVCRTGDFTLKFQSATPIPFAVRLAEIELTNEQLRIKEGKFKFPKSLGASTVEQTTAEVEPESLGNLVHDTSK